MGNGGMAKNIWVGGRYCHTTTLEANLDAYPFALLTSSLQAAIFIWRFLLFLHGL